MTDATSSVSEDEDLLIHQGTHLPLPLPPLNWLRCILINLLTILLIDIDVDSVQLLGTAVRIIMGGHTKRLTRSHGILSSCQADGEDGLHLVVVLDGLVEELDVFVVILGTQNIVRQ